MGQFDIRLDGKPIEIRSRPTQSLLAYLLLNAGTALRREKLSGVLWPDSTEANARNSLRQALWRLHQALDLESDYLLVDDFVIAFNTAAPHWLDAAVLGQKDVEAGPLEDLISAVSVYEGELLPGFYEDWVSLERERLEAIFEQKMKSLLDRLVGEQRWGEVLDWGERWIALGHTPESAYRALMYAHAASGDISSVAGVYRRCSDALNKELGVEPSDHTRAVYERLSKGEIRGYELRQHVSTGEFGSLYRAYHRLVGREVAFKAILPEYANQPDFIRRFEAEAQLIAKVEHPHILPLYDYWREPDGAYIVMRWMRGGSLRLLLQNGPLTASDIARLVDQIAGALTSAHRQGLVHGHLKPENVLFDDDGNAYLTHFGISSDVRLIKRNGKDAAPTPLTYLSPEQIRGEPATPWSDQYSLGLLISEILTGQSPLDQPKAIKTQASGVNPFFPEPREPRLDLPSDLNTVIQQATALNPEDRFSDVMAFVIALRQTLGTSATTTSGQSDLPHVGISNPYKGLRPFRQADAADFFGREALTEQLLAGLSGSQDAGRFLAVVGPSGSGKSSVVKAGLLPALRRGAIPDSEKWFIVEMSSGAHPLEELEIGLLRIAVNQPTGLMEQLQRDERGLLRAIQLVLPDDESELVLVIDQFEHVFTLVEDTAEASHFLKCLFVAVTDPTSRLRVIITLRADFYDRPLLHPDFGSLLRQHTEVVTPLTADELMRAIVGPAERVGVTLEPGLVTAIVADMNEQPSALPLLQYALTELFERREGRQLTRKAYQLVGGVGGALARRAEEVYAGLDKAGQSAARQLFLRLVTLGEGVKDTRRQILQSELMSIGFGRPPPQSSSAISWQAGVMEAVIKAFGRSRLLSFDRDPGTRTPTVQMAHSALMREWPRLSDWLDLSRVDLRMQSLLAAAADEWLNANQETSFLLQGARLAQFEGWAASTDLALTNHERTYLEASLAERQAQQVQETTRQKREQEAMKKLWRRNRAITVVAGMALVLAILAGALWYLRQQQIDIALSRELAAQAMSLTSDQPELAGLLSIEALNTYDTVEARIALIAAQEQQEQQPLKLRGHEGPVRSVVFSPDGETLASASTDGTVLFWDDTAHPASGAPLDLADPTTALARSPDGKRIALAAGDIYLRPWPGAPGEPITLTNDAGLVTSLAFSPDGETLASGNADNNIVLWDLATGQAIGEPLTGHTDWVYSVAFSPDGRRLASGSKDKTIILWDVTTQQPLGGPLDGHTDWVYSVAFSPDGRRLASGSADNTVIQWDVATQNLIDHPLRGHASYVHSVAFSPDGQTVASGSEDGTIRLWDSFTNQAIGQPLPGNADAVYSVAFSPDGNRLASGSHDGMVAFWDVDWESRVCEAAGRNLTRIEWGRYLPPNRDYQKTCADWPEDNDDTVKILVYSSKSKEDWINAATAAFNAAQIETDSGKTIDVTVTQVNSGGSMRDILDGKIQPTVWSPGEQSWVDQANNTWQARTGRPLIPEICSPTVNDPIGFAMWRPMAEAMGWPDQPISWDTFASLAADPQGWAAYGHPEWGQFNFGHTLPDFSNSGLLIMAALAYDRLGLSSGLTPELVKSDVVMNAMREVEEHTIHYGTQSEDLLALMVQRGSSYLHAVNTNEAEVLKTNAKYGNLLPFPLVFIFPAHGTFWAQHPYCILDAEWVTEEQHEAAQLYADYLLSPEQQALAVKKGLRPADQTISLHSPISLENGTDPRITPATVPSLPSPISAVADAIKEVFHLVERTDIPSEP